MLLQKGSKNMSDYRLRPHHGLCIAFFRGNGYSPAFTANMTDIIARLDRENPLITITDETDMICGSCPHNSGGVCISDEKVADFDKAVLDACGLRFHDNIRWKIFKELVSQNIIIPGKRTLICGDCQWNDLCTTIENEK